MQALWKKWSSGSIACILMVLLAHVACAQDPARFGSTIPLEFPQYSNFNFERLLNTLSWSEVLHYDRQFESWSLQFDQQYRARLIRGLQESHQNEYMGSVEAKVPFWQQWHGLVTTSSLANLDDRARELGTTIQHRLLAGVGLSVTERITASLQGGFEWNKQGTEHDQGGSYLVRLNGQNVVWDEFTLDFNGQWTESLLGARRPRTGDARFSLWRKFSDVAEDSLTISISDQARSFFVAADPGVRSAFGISHNLFDRSALGWQLQNRLRYRMDDGLALTIDAGLGNRTIDRGNRYRVLGTAPAIADARVQELQLSGGAQLDWALSGRFRIASAVTHAVREERHVARPEADFSPTLLSQQQALARRLENIAARTSAWIGTDITISDADRLQLRSSATILRYDTPDTLNTDDRDELYLTLAFEVTHRFSPMLMAALGIDVSGTHLVYLSRLQSANNTWNRVIRLGTRVEYRNVPRFENVLKAEVIGNYTVSDYEEQVAAVRSFSFRQAAWSDSLSWKFSATLGLLCASGLRLTERGALRWREFSERPEDATVELHVDPRIVAHVGTFRFNVGYRYFSQDRYSYVGGVRSFQQGYVSVGPVASVEWQGGAERRVSIEGWRESQRINSRVLTAIPNMSVAVRLPL